MSVKVALTHIPDGGMWTLIEEDSKMSEEVTIVGRNTGQKITITRYGVNDYSAWWHETDLETDGCSVRGTLAQIITEIKDEI